MYCEHCGTRLRDEGHYCGSCGAARALDREPFDPLRRARSLVAAGDPRGAAEVLRAALQANPDDRALRIGLAAVLFQAHEWSGGLAHLDRLRDGAFDPLVEAYTAGALLALGRIEEAKDVLDRAHDRAPNDFAVALKRGELFCRLGIYPTAVRELERAIALGTPDLESSRAVEMLLRFAREKSRHGFIRRLVAAGVS